MQLVIQCKMVNQTLVFFLVFLVAVKCDEKSLYLQSLQKFVDTQQLSSACLNQINNLDQGAKLQMLDAGFRIPSGLAAGNFFELGNYDECLNIDSKATDGSGKIYGRYCLGTYPFTALSQGENATLEFLEFHGERKLPLKLRPIHPEPRMLGTDLALMGWHVALCVPDKCTAKDLSGILTFTEQFCYSSVADKGLDTEAIIGTSILSVFLLIVIVSTLFDVYLFYKELETSHPLLTAFSFLSNGRKLFATTSNPNQLQCLNGIKAVSMMWVILGHMYSSMYTNALTNSGTIQDFMKELPNMFVVSATVSVDSFFVVGGLVMVYTFMKTMEKSRVKDFNIFLFYLHRYLRLTPALAACILLSATLIKYMGDGPLWGNVDDSFCREHWWSALLYIQNYVNPLTMCLGQSWYLSVDMQLFVLTPIIIIPLVIWPRYTMWCLYALAVAGVIVPFAIAFDLKMNGIIGASDTNYMKHYYIQTYARFATYVIGMILGYYVYKLKETEKPRKIHWATVSGLWIVILGGLVANLYAPHGLVTDEYDRWAHSLYVGFNRAGWGVCLSGLIYLCIAGYGGPINAFLSIPVFQFLSKISYSMYLVHYNLIGMWFASKRTTMKFSNIEAMMDFWGIFMLTLALSLILCLVFESPVIIIEKCIFGTGTKKSHPKSNGTKLDVEMSKS